MSFLSGLFSSEYGISMDFGGLLGAIGAGPAGWTGDSSLWAGIGSRVGFEVTVAGVFGAAPGGSLTDRAQAAEQAGDVVVIGRSSKGGDDGVRVIDLNNGIIVDLYDGGGNDWSVFEVPVPRPPAEEPPPSDPYQADPSQNPLWDYPLYQRWDYEMPHVHWV